MRRRDALDDRQAEAGARFVLLGAPIEAVEDALAARLAECPGPASSTRSSVGIGAGLDLELDPRAARRIAERRCRRGCAPAGRSATASPFRKTGARRAQLELDVARGGERNASRRRRVRAISTRSTRSYALGSATGLAARQRQQLLDQPRRRARCRRRSRRARRRARRRRWRGAAARAAASAP